MNDLLQPTAVIETIKTGNLMQQQLLRPRTAAVEQAAPFLAVIQRCWQENALLRGEITAVHRDICKIMNRRPGRNDRNNVLRKILSRLERYAIELDRQVAERTADLIAETNKCDQLLREIFPSLIVASLRSGVMIEPELFNSVSIFFSSVSGFADLLSVKASEFIMQFLNDIYVVFDAVCYSFCVYKVETIADSYMVSSGVPERNDDNHIREVNYLPGNRAGGELNLP